MYFQKDYVLRMIEMLGDLIRKILSGAEDTVAREELDEVANKACGLPLSMLKTGDPETLARTLEEPQRFLAAELLMIDLAISLRTQMDDELMPLRAQAIMLYSSLQEPDYALPAADRVAQMIRDFLGELPVQALLAAAILLEYAGAFAGAEDALFAAMDQAPEHRETIIAFYARLDALEDSTLATGGLSRDEIAEGREALN